MPECKFLEWVANLKRNLADFFVIAGDKMALAKCKMKSNYDKHSSPSLIFKSGDVVLLRTPGLSFKVSDYWLRLKSIIITQVTFVSKTKVVHVNMLKCWHAADGMVRRVVVADEMDDLGPPDNVSVHVLSDDRVAYTFFFSVFIFGIHWFYFFD